jgi:hypothetical protein
MLMRDVAELWSSSFLPWARPQAAIHSQETKGGNMKKLLALVALALCISAPSFAADAVGHSVKDAGKVTYKAAKDTGKAGKAVVKFLL